MSKIILIFFISIFYSCSTMSSDWGDWYLQDSPTKDREWHFCIDELDGPELHRKGICYQSKECRDRKTILGNKRTECRRAPLFCPWGDFDCLIKYGINSMSIKNKL